MTATVPADADAGSGDARAASRGGIALLLLQTLGRGLGLVFVLVATREVATADFGRISIVASVVFFGTFLSDFGTTPVITRWVSREPSSADALLSALLLPSLGLGLLAYGLGLGFTWAARYDHQVLVDTAIGGLAVPATAVLTTFLATLDGRGHLAKRAAVTFASTAVAAGGGAAAILVTGDVRWAIAFLAVAPAVCVVLAGALAHRLEVWSGAVHLDRGTIRRVAVSAVPFALFGGLSALSGRFDVILLSLVEGRRATATYDLALRATEAAAFVATALTAPALFLLSSRLGRQDGEGAQRAFRHLVKACFLTGLLLSSVFVGANDQVCRLLFGDGYEGTATLVAIIGSALWLNFGALAQGALIASGDHLRRGLATSACITAGYLVLTVALVAVWGAVGAAVSTASIQLVTVLAFARFHRATSGIRTPPPPVGAVLAALLAAGCGPLLGDRSPLLVLTATVLVFGVVAVATRAVTGADVALLRRVVAPAPGAAT